MGRPPWAVPFGAVCCLAAAPAVPAQVTTTLDGLLSRVHYDGFLPAAAVSLGGAVALNGRMAALHARTSALLFETGNTTWQGSFSAAYFTRPPGPLRQELWVTAGASRYAYFPMFWHTIGGARLHVPWPGGTAWVDASLGHTSLSDSLRPVAMLGGGVAARPWGGTATVAASYVRVGDTTYTDVQATARSRIGRVDLDAVLGTRLWSDGGGRGVYGEAAVAVPLGERSALVLSAGRYPTDPWRGTISGRYASAGLRIRPGSAAPRVPTPERPSVIAVAGAPTPDNHSTAAALEAQPAGGGTVRLVVRATGVSTVEVVGDFTDWHPLAVPAAGPGVWAVTVRMTSGSHRLNVRLDRGPWFVPAGATRAADDYGTDIGIIVIP